MKVHPFADRWPMMSDDELADLAADIKANGLLHPIATATIDGELMLIDGRNRRLACELAGVKPRYQELNGQDPIAFIISSNAARRQMGKGALAMVVATQYPKVPKVGRGQKVSATETFPMVSSGKLSMARTILEYAAELVDAVIAGGKSLDAAYAEALDRKNVAASDEHKMQRLRREAPDLAELVVEERMTIGEGIAALAKRIEDLEREKRNAAFLLHQALIGLNPRAKTAEEWADEMLELIDPQFWPNNAAAELTAACINACADALDSFAKKWEVRHGKQGKKG